MITLVTVTYNAGHTLERTLQSVAVQSYRDVEHIIMDGASKDNTVEIARNYQQSNPDLRITVVSERDKGLYDAMNKALALATGDFVCFLNAGDKLHNPDTLQNVADTIAANPDAGIVYGNTDLVDDEGNFLRHRRLQPAAHIDWHSFKHGMLICHQSFYVSRGIAPAYSMNYRFSADFDWCIRCMKEGVAVPVTDRKNNKLVVLTDYLSEGMTTANHKASLLERLHIMAHHYGWITAIVMHLWFILRSIIRK